ncbi:MAG: macro domain-containing protein [Gemmatimonadota bacterium]|nr:macro domain-containing protein [Gemmatimonadota bacterium]
MQHRPADLAVDAIVRAADASLAPLGAASAALDDAAGPRFQSLRQVVAPLDAGAAVITGAGDLAAEFVLHIVLASEERATTPEIVRRALVSAWHRAEGWELTTIGAPLGAVAVADLSLDTAVRLLIDTFQERRPDSRFPAELQIIVTGPTEQALVDSLLERVR